MQKIIDVIYRICAFLLFISFFLAIFGGMLSLRINVERHIFEFGPFFLAIMFICIFVTFSLTPSWGSGRKVGGWLKHVMSLLILAFAVITSYFGIYLPFHSRLVVELPHEYLELSQPFILPFEQNKRYYIMVDTYRSINGSKIVMKASNGEWSDEYSFTVGAKRDIKDKTTFRTTLIDLPFAFPKDGIYKLHVMIETGTSSLGNIRLFEK
jgi:hypothetical protein